MSASPERRWQKIGLGVAAGLGAAGGLVFAGIRFAGRIAPTSGLAARGRHAQAPSAEAIRTGYEVKDLSAKGVAYILAGLGGSAVTLIAITFGMIWLFSSWDRENDRGMTVEQTRNVEPPAPRLQTEPFRDRAVETKHEMQAMSYYGWNDAAHTTAHVPIGRAIELVIGQSLGPRP